MPDLGAVKKVQKICFVLVLSVRKKLCYFELSFGYLLLISAKSIITNVTKKIKAFCNYKSFTTRDNWKNITCIVSDENQGKLDFSEKKAL